MSGFGIIAGFAFSAMVTVILVVMAVRSFMANNSSADDVDRAQMLRKSLALDDSQDESLLRHLQPLALKLFKPDDDDELADLRLKLYQGGLVSQKAVDRYAVIQLLSLLVAAPVALVWVAIATSTLLPFGLLLCIAGALYGPRTWLHMRTTNRREKISLALSSTLDLLVTCMEAGLNLEQAMERVASELVNSEPEMAQELTITINELRAGITTSQAFRKLSSRVGLPEMHMLCIVIIQSHTLGASIGQMLRQYSSSWRTQRMMALEEHAGKVSAGLVLPLILCLLPSALLAMLGPATIMLLTQMQ